MFNAVRLLLPLLALLTGCATPSPHSQQAADWEVTPPPSPSYKPAAPPMTNSPTLPPDAGTTWVSLKGWVNQRNHTNFTQLTSSPPATYAISAGPNTLVLEIGNLVARWNGMQVWLGFAAMMGGEPYVHSLDLQKNIDPLLNMGSTGLRGNGIIVLDPGHGGGNSGTQSVLDARYEKEFALDWAQRLVPLLERQGWRVFLTRTNDADIPLADRVQFAEDHAADFFLSLHFNASPAGGQAAGLETYCLTPTGMASSLVREFEDNPELTFPNNAFDAQNLQFAVRLHRAMLQVNGLVDRGVRRARFMGILRGQKRPAVLLEGGYLSNPEEARRIAEPEYRQKLAEAVASAFESLK